MKVKVDISFVYEIPDSPAGRTELYRTPILSKCLQTDHDILLEDVRDSAGPEGRADLKVQLIPVEGSRSLLELRQDEVRALLNLGPEAKLPSVCALCTAPNVPEDEDSDEPRPKLKCTCWAGRCARVSLCECLDFGFRRNTF